MDFQLDEEHRMLKDLAARFVKDELMPLEKAVLHLLKHGLAWAQLAEAGKTAPIADAKVRLGLAEVKARLLVQDALARRCLWAASMGAAHKANGPMATLFGSESWLACSALFMRLAAPRSLLSEYSALGQIEKRSRRAIPGTIYAGTSEVQRSLIAERALDLPRSRS